MKMQNEHVLLYKLSLLQLIAAKDTAFYCNFSIMAYLNLYEVLTVTHLDLQKITVTHITAVKSTARLTKVP